MSPFYILFSQQAALATLGVPILPTYFTMFIAQAVRVGVLPPLSPSPLTTILSFQLLFYMLMKRSSDSRRQFLVGVLPPYSPPPFTPNPSQPPSPLLTYYSICF